MDDREFEARLRTHLHRRFDDADAPRTLRAGVEQLLVTPPRPTALTGIRFQPRIRLGASLGLVGALVVAVALAFNVVRGPSTAGPSGSGSPSPSIGAHGPTYILLPPGSGVPSAGDSSTASDVLAARLHALGLQDFSVEAGLVELPDAQGLSDDLIRSVIGAPGEVAIVPLPPSVYGNALESGAFTATVGQPLPKPEPSIIGRDGIASAAWGSGSPAALEIKLTPAASQVFEDWSGAHVGEMLAILVDGRVLSAPVVRQAVIGGSITIEQGVNDPPPPADAVAVLIGGELPVSWRPGEVVKPIPQEQAEAAALAAAHGGIVTYAGLHVGTAGPLGTWRAYWDVQVDAPTCSAPQPCASAMSQLVRVDAATGEVFHVGNLAP